MELSQLELDQLGEDVDVRDVIQSMKMYLGMQPVTNSDNLRRVAGMYKMLNTAKGSHSLFRGSSYLAGVIGQKAAYLIDEAVALKTKTPELTEECDDLIDETTRTLIKYRGLLFPKYSFRPIIRPPVRYGK